MVFFLVALREKKKIIYSTILYINECSGKLIDVTNED